MPETTDLYTTTPSRIVMYSVDWCPDCRRARFFFKPERPQRHAAAYLASRHYHLIT